jgi:hypothetical protein
MIEINRGSLFSQASYILLMKRKNWYCYDIRYDQEHEKMFSIDYYAVGDGVEKSLETSTFLNPFKVDALPAV